MSSEAQLDWPRFLDLAGAEARTEPGKRLVARLEDSAAWARDLPAARQLQHEVQEAVALLERDSLWGPLTGLFDPSPQLERLGRGAVLEVADLVILRGWLYAFDSWVQIPREELRGERLKAAIGKLMDPDAAIRMLEKILTPQGELSEKASPRLASLYSEIRTLKRDIGVMLDQLIKTFSQKGVLQENFTDVRDGRYVIPVKISSQNDVDGIIYEASASRQTVFVEPREVAPLNNRLRQRQNDLLQEIYVILEAASKKLMPLTSQIALSVEIVSHWDSIQARARFGRRYSGKPIDVTDERTFWLRQTAHPLLWWSLDPATIVRNEIDFGEPARTLLLTGPNTGGKTVLLKTLGLAGLCARTGFPFPAIEQPKVPFFDAFFADLGDPQSIERHLSSFSGHILRFKQIIESVTPRSLVLIDELNSATDPEEGAALGRAVLEAMMESGALVVSTTHDPHLKAIALSDKRIVNASMEFDERSRTPTYNMVIGVPGRSRALETAERLGIPEKILQKARGYLSKEHVQFESMIAKLEEDSRETTRARKEAVALREEAEKLRKEWHDRTGANINDMLDRTRSRLKRILEQAQDEVRSQVRKLDDTRSRRELDQTRAQLNDSIGTAASRMESALSEEAPELARAIEVRAPSALPTAPSLAVAVGVVVRVPKWKSTGQVLEISGNKIKVALGAMQISLALSDVEPLTPAELALLPKSKASAPSRGAITRLESVETPPPQIDLRGIRLDDAVAQLEKYLDQAFRSGSLAQVTIVHGLGTGAIREGTRALLKSLPYIKEYRDAGNAGATLVEFERD